MRAFSLVALAFGTLAGGSALAQPAVDESPDAPDASPAKPAVKSGVKKAAPTAEAKPAAAKPVEAKPAETKPTEAKPAPKLSTTTTPNANVQAKPAEGLPSWEPAPVAPGTPGQDLAANWDTAAGPAAAISYPWIESHGYLRMRADLFLNFDLDTYDEGLNRGSSPYDPPENGGESQASANIRLRYQPTVHVSETLRIKGTFDVLDNLVLGSTPDGGAIGGSRGYVSRPDVPTETFSGSQRVPESGINGYRDSVRVKHLWGEWKTPVGLLTFGRMQSHWGLGLLANSGNCLDCDFGDSVDRIMGVTKLFGTYLALGWDFPSEGFVGYPGMHDNLNQGAGQAFDLDQRDDVNEWVLAIFRKPITQEEQEHRKRDLNELRKPVFDWGVYNVIRNQAKAIEGTGSLPAAGPGDVNNLNSDTFVYIPDVWLNWEYRPAKDTRYHVQFEAAGIIGSIDEVPIGAIQSKDVSVCLDDSFTVDNCPAGELISPRKRDITQWGYALEFDAQHGKIHWGVHQGAASGDSTDGFGVLDRLPLDSTSSRDANDQEINNFKFDRDYHVDLIMFREVIGAVTNAAYIKPWIGYNFVQTDREAWGFKVSGIYGHALEADATPGNEASLGFEADLELFVEEFDRFKWSISYGLWVPGAAFNQLDENEQNVIADPAVAQTIQTLIGIQF
jgi:uncharacterized protein (TIGR04551 family)